MDYKLQRTLLEALKKEGMTPFINSLNEVFSQDCICIEKAKKDGLTKVRFTILLCPPINKEYTTKWYTL